MNKKWNLLWILMGLLAVSCNGLNKPPITLPPPPPVGNVPAGLVGIWQDTLASSGVFINPVTGEQFTMTSGYSAQLKIAVSGQFTFTHYSSGVATNCSFVGYRDQMVGVAEFQNNRLTLKPRERRLDVTNCTNSGSRTLPLDPVSFVTTLSDYETLIGEITSQLQLSDGPYPLNFKLLNREPPNDPAQPSAPTAFQLGNQTPYNELIGLWVPGSPTDTNFYNPQTGDFYIPELNGGDHRWIRFVAGGYEMAIAIRNASTVGVCEKDLIYYEKGSATFNLLENIGGNGNRFIGDLRLEADDARLIVNIRNCATDDGVKRYNLKPLTGYYQWGFSPPNTFDLGCQHRPWHAWQFASCPNSNWNGFSRRE